MSDVVPIEDAKFKNIVLQFPIDMGDGKSITAIKMSRRFTVGHLRLIPQEFMDMATEKKEKGTLKKTKGGKMDLLKLIPLLAALCNLSEETFDKMDFMDLMTVSQEIENFFPKELFQETGRN